jgi:hypothetical protein
VNTNNAVKFLPTFSEEKKLEVILETEKDSNQVTLKLSTWVESLGWCGQKTMNFDAEMLDDLHRAIMAARYKLQANKAQREQGIEKSNVINFPVSK